MSNQDAARLSCQLHLQLVSLLATQSWQIKPTTGKQFWLVSRATMWEHSMPTGVRGKEHSSLQGSSTSQDSKMMPGDDVYVLPLSCRQSAFCDLNYPVKNLCLYFCKVQL